MLSYDVRWSKVLFFIAQLVPFYFYNKRNFSFTTRLPFHLQEIVLKWAKFSSGWGLLQAQRLEVTQKYVLSLCLKVFGTLVSYISFTIDVESGEKIKLINFLSLLKTYTKQSFSLPSVHAETFGQKFQINKKPKG